MFNTRVKATSWGLARGGNIRGRQIQEGVTVVLRTKR